MRAVLFATFLALTALAGCASDDAGPDPTASPGPTETQSSTPTSEPGPTPTQTTDPEPGPKRDPVTWDVDIQGNQFRPADLTIQVGDTVRWTQRDSVPHTVTSGTGATESFDSGNMVMTQTFSHTFVAVGDNPYFCQVHPSMTAVVRVLEQYDSTP